MIPEQPRNWYRRHRRSQPPKEYASSQGRLCLWSKISRNLWFMSNCFNKSTWVTTLNKFQKANDFRLSIAHTIYFSFYSECCLEDFLLFSKFIHEFFAPKKAVKLIAESTTLWSKLRLRTEKYLSLVRASRRDFWNHEWVEHEEGNFGTRSYSRYARPFRFNIL